MKTFCQTGIEECADYWKSTYIFFVCFVLYFLLRDWYILTLLVDAFESTLDICDKNALILNNISICMILNEMIILKSINTSTFPGVLISGKWKNPYFFIPCCMQSHKHGVSLRFLISYILIVCVAAIHISKLCISLGWLFWWMKC